MGLLFIFLPIWLGRRQLLSVRYALGWSVSGALMVGVAGYLALSAPGKGFRGVPAALLLVGLSCLLLLISLQLSISISGMQRQLRELVLAEAIRHVETQPDDSIIKSAPESTASDA